jgi:hypothetical protein
LPVSSALAWSRVPQPKLRRDPIARTRHIRLRQRLPGHPGRYSLPRRVADPGDHRVSRHRVCYHRIGHHWRLLPNDRSPAPGAHPSRGRYKLRFLGLTNNMRTTPGQAPVHGPQPLELEDRDSRFAGPVCAALVEAARDAVPEPEPDVPLEPPPGFSPSDGEWVTEWVDD